jgi:hypothetical protein
VSVTVFLATTKNYDELKSRRDCDDSFLARMGILGRILQGVLGLVVVVVLAIVALQKKKKTLLCAEPWSLVGLTTLVANWGALKEGFAAINEGDSKGNLCAKVWGRKYRLVDGVFRGKQHLGIEALRNTTNEKEATAEKRQSLDIPNS